MARLKEWMDVSEAGDSATPISVGWVADGNGGFGVADVNQTQVYHDSRGNGGAYAMRAHAGTFAGDEWFGWKTPALITPVPTFRDRFHYYRGIAPNLESTVCFWSLGINNTDSLGCVTVMPDGHLKLYSGGHPPTNVGLAGATLLATSTNTLSPNTWYLIEVGITIGNVGAYEVRVNRTSVGWIPAGIGDTQPGSATTVDRFWYVSENDAGSGGRGDDSWFDDMAADDANWISEGLITTLLPNGYGVSFDLTPHGAVNNWQCVDEIPPSDTDFNETLVANKKDIYVHTALPGAASIAHAVLLLARVTTVGGGIGSGYLIVRSAGANYEGSAHVLPLSYGIISDLRTVDPATSAAWTIAAINASEIGIRFDT